MNPKLILCLAFILSGLLFVGNCSAAIIFPKQAEAYRSIACSEAIAFYRTAPFYATTFNHGERFLTPEHLPLDQLGVTNGFKSYYVDYRLGSYEKLLSIAITPSDWCYMLMCGTNALGVIGLKQNHSNHWAFGGATSMGQPDLRWVGLERAKELPQVKNNNYEFRTLDFSGDDSPMIWLHSDSDDILIPLSDGYGKWKAYKPYSEKQIAKLLKPEVEDELKRSKMDRAISSELEDYEKVNGNECGTITYMPGVSYLKNVGANVWICKLYVKSSKCDFVNYKAKITFTDETRSAVKYIEILGKLPETNNMTKP